MHAPFSASGFLILFFHAYETESGLNLKIYYSVIIIDWEPYKSRNDRGKTPRRLN